MGGGLGSISLLIASETGWRSTCFGVGATGLLLAIVFFAVVREPERGAGDRLERANSSSSGMVPEGLEGSVREENKPLAEGEDGEAGKDSEGRGTQSSIFRGAIAPLTHSLVLQQTRLRLRRAR